MNWLFTSQVNMRGSSGHACSRPVAVSDDWTRTTSAVAECVEYLQCNYIPALLMHSVTVSIHKYYCCTWICVGYGYSSHYCNGGISNNHLILYDIVTHAIGKKQLI